MRRRRPMGKQCRSGLTTTAKGRNLSESDGVRHRSSSVNHGDIGERSVRSCSSLCHVGRLPETRSWNAKQLIMGEQGFNSNILILNPIYRKNMCVAPWHITLLVDGYKAGRPLRCTEGGTRSDARFCHKFSCDFHWPVGHIAVAVQPTK